MTPAYPLDPAPRPHAPPRVDGARHRHPDDPAKARWYAQSRRERYAHFILSLAHGRTREGLT